MTPQLQRLTRSGTDAARRGERSAARLLKHEFVPGSDGPHLSLPPNQVRVRVRVSVRVSIRVRANPNPNPSRSQGEVRANLNP